MNNYIQLFNVDIITYRLPKLNADFPNLAWQKEALGKVVLLHPWTWWEIDIQGCYSLNFAPLCAYKNKRQTLRHNASTPRSRDVTYQLWWRHNAQSENSVLSDNGEISDW